MSELARHHRVMVVLAASVLVLAAVAGLVLVRWRHYNAQQSGRIDPEALPLPAPAQDPAAVLDPNAGYIVIADWGIRMKPTAAIGNVHVVNNGEVAAFSTATLEAIDEHCRASTMPLQAPLGILERSSVPLRTISGQDRVPTGHIGGQYYYFSGPQASCLSGSNDTAQHSAQAGRLLLEMQRMIPTLEAIQ